MYWLRYTVLLVISRVRELAVHRFPRGETRGGRDRGSHWIQRLAGKDRRIGGGSQLGDEERGARALARRLTAEGVQPGDLPNFPPNHPGYRYRPHLGFDTRPHLGFVTKWRYRYRPHLGFATR